MLVSISTYYHLIIRLHLGLASCLNHVFNRKRVLFRIKPCIQLLCLFGLLQSGTVPQVLTFMTLILWKITVQLFCRLSLNLG